MFYLFEYADKILCVLRALARTAFVLTHELPKKITYDCFILALAPIIYTFAFFEPPGFIRYAFDFHAR